MSGINFKRDDGYAAGSRAWCVMCPDRTISARQYESRELAEVAAAEPAHGKPGHTYHIVATVATVTTEVKIVGQNFDPARQAFPELAAPPSPPPLEVEDRKSTRLNSSH